VLSQADRAAPPYLLMTVCLRGTMHVNAGDQTTQMQIQNIYNHTHRKLIAGLV